jgi:hypothetical protein
MTPTHVEYFPLPTSQDLLDAFSEEIATAGGTVSNALNDGQRLIARAVLPAAAEIRRGDQVSAGVAIRAMSNEIVVHPYTLRQVCTNGAIAAEALESQRFERIHAETTWALNYEASMLLTRVHDAIRACSTPEAFATTVGDMRLAATTDGAMAIHVLIQSKYFAEDAARVASYMDIIDRYRAGDDQSAFGVMNAVTSLARDMRDPELRWSLEQLGGSVPALVRHRIGKPGHDAITEIAHERTTP